MIKVRLQGVMRRFYIILLGRIMVMPVLRWEVREKRMEVVEEF